MRDQSKPDETLNEIHAMVTELVRDTLPREFIEGIYHGQWIYPMHGPQYGSLRTYVPADHSYLEIELMDTLGSRVWIRKFLASSPIESQPIEGQVKLSSEEKPEP